MKTLLLDLGGVVFNSTGLSNEKIDWAIISELNNKYGHQLNIEDIKIDVFLEEYNRRTKQALLQNEFLTCIFDTLEFNAELIRFLQPKFTIHILSDNYRENIEYISQRYHFDDWSVRQFYSFDFKTTKREPAIFESVLQALELSAAEVLFIDDSPEKLENARKCGITSILFRDNAQVFREVEEVLG